MKEPKKIQRFLSENHSCVKQRDGLNEAKMKWTVMADTPIVTGKEPLCKILSVKETEISNDYEDQ